MSSLNPKTNTTFVMSPSDYVARTYDGTATVTYTFKTGGASGTVTNVIKIVYTDSSLGTISTVTKT